jgi:hypothetical protein
MITKPKLKQLRTYIDEDVNKLLQEKFGVRLDIGSIRFDSNQASGRMTITSTENLGVEGRDAKLLADFKNGLWKYKHLGLTESHHGKMFAYNGETWKLVGLNTRAPKYPFIAIKVSTGQEFRLAKNAISNIVAKQGG